MFWSVLRSKPKVFRLVLASYLLVMLVPLGLGALLFRGATRAVREEALAAHFAGLEKGRDAVDRELQLIDTMLIQLAQNQQVNVLLSVQSAFEGSAIYRVIDAWKELSRPGAVLPFVQDVFTTFERSGVTLTPRAAYVRMDLFDKSFFSSGDKSFNGWKATFADTIGEKGWLPLRPLF